MSPHSYKINSNSKVGNALSERGGSGWPKIVRIWFLFIVAGLVTGFLISKLDLNQRETTLPAVSQQAPELYQQ